MPGLSVAVITYMNSGLLYRCLSSLVCYTRGVDRILVVNNNPGEVDRRAVDLEVAKIPWPVEVLHQKYNRRASGGINAGLEASIGADYFCAVSDDVMFVPGNPFWPSMKMIASVSEVGLVGPTIDRGSSPLQLAATVIPSEFLQTNYIMGMLLFARKGVWDQITPCDETLEGTEEADLCLSCMARGYKVIINRQVYIYHEGAATMRKLYNHEEYQARGLRAGEQVIAKHGEDVFFNPSSLSGFPRLPSGEPAPMTRVDPSRRTAMHIALSYFPQYPVWVA